MKKHFKRGARAILAAAALAVVASGCGDSRDNFVFTSAQVPLVAPLAVDDAINALGNATLQQTSANGVLANDTVNGAAIVAFDSTTANGGTVILNDDGSFAYTAPSNFRGNDSFSYTLENPAGQSTATVTLNVAALAFFVDNTAAAGGSGRQSEPYDTLNDALTDPDLQAGDTVFVFRGDGTSAGQTGAFTLPPGVRLVGEGEGLLLQTVVSQGQEPVLEGPITLMGQNTVTGFLINNSAGRGITANTVGDITIHNNTFRTPADGHVELLNVGGNVAITENSFEQLVGSDDAVLVRSINTNGTWNISNNTFLDDASNAPDDAVEFNVEGNSQVELTFTGNQFSGDNPSDSFDYALGLVGSGTSRITANITDNTAIDLAASGFIIVLVDSAGLTGSVNGNEIDNVSLGIELTNASDGPVALSFVQNMISNAVSAQGILLDHTGAAQHDATYTIDGNAVTNTIGPGIMVSQNSSNGASQVVTFVLNNTTTDTSLSPSLDAFLGAAGNLCLDVENNTVNSDMLFRNDGTGSLDVEEFNTLDTINTFIGVAEPREHNPGDVTPVADGFCQTL